MIFLNTNRWIVKWGLLGLKRKDYKPILDKEDASEELKIDNFINIFNKSQYIFDIKTNKLKETMIRGDGIFKLLNPICLSIKIPKRETEKSSLFKAVKDNVDFGTEFNVLYDGYLYIIFRKIDHTKRIFEGEVYVRKILEDIIKESDNFEPLSIPPTPFREELFLDFSHKNEIDDIQVNAEDNNNIKIVLPKSIQIENFFLEFYTHMEHDFFNYFLNLERVKELGKIESKIINSFIELTNDCLLFQNLDFHQFYKKYKMNTKIKKDIANQFINILEYQNNFESYMMGRDKSLKEIKYNQFFINYYDEFEEEIKYNRYNFEFMHTLIDYSKTILVSHEGNVNSIIGVMLGGTLTIIGIFIGKLI